MDSDLAEIRLRQLVGSPGGGSLLIAMAHNGITPEKAVDPETSLHLVASAVGELNPWNPGHDPIVARIRHEAAHLDDLARELLAQPGIERWWAPLDRERQIWLQPWPEGAFPTPETFPTPTSPLNSWECYAQKPGDRVSTSTGVDGWSAQFANCVSGATDWHLDYPAHRKLIRISPQARVLEITSVDEWHAMVVAHGVRSDPASTSHPDIRGVPWGTNDGLVPDWASIASEWDGVHVTLWAFLTGTQVRVSSEDGWSEMWSGESEETTWLRWVFDAVEEMPPVGPSSQGRRYSLPFDIYTSGMVDPSRPYWTILKPTEHPG